MPICNELRNDSRSWLSFPNRTGGGQQTVRLPCARWSSDRAPPSPAVGPYERWSNDSHKRHRQSSATGKSHSSQPHSSPQSVVIRLVSIRCSPNLPCACPCITCHPSRHPSHLIGHLWPTGYGQCTPALAPARYTLKSGGGGVGSTNVGRWCGYQPIELDDRATRKDSAFFESCFCS